MLKAGSTGTLARFGRLAGLALGALVLVACTTPNRAPVVDLSGTPGAGTETAGGAATYVVRPGDTLYSIARQHQVAWQDIATWNGISDPSQLRVGRTLRVGQGAGSAPPMSSGTSVAQVQPIATPDVESRPLDGSAQAPATPRQPVRANDSGIDWTWPSPGKVIAEYNQALNKGLDLEGNIGDPVLAAADGTVVYAGSGLRGYGNLLIVRHNATFLSAYAHNSKLLVNEGDAVKRGQRIAELGQSDAPSPRLHFEIRRGGTPEDPRQFLPARP
ncbi:MAG: peptidoglycan DD-metalloendopeptidase family protein [Pigmentiphaga sp.]|nr:peptidoglycan DD-metalloendopeptidase family protein [Pigmentiphaga sp.]